jgi:hypothetical protein
LIWYWKKRPRVTIDQARSPMPSDQGEAGRDRPDQATWPRQPAFAAELLRRDDRGHDAGGQDEGGGVAGSGSACPPALAHVHHELEHHPDRHSDVERRGGVARPEDQWLGHAASTPAQPGTSRTAHNGLAR